MLLNRKRFGFPSRKSSTDAELYFIEKRKRIMEDNNDRGAVFSDLAKLSKVFKISLNQVFYFPILFS